MHIFDSLDAVAIVVILILVRSENLAPIRMGDTQQSAGVIVGVVRGHAVSQGLALHPAGGVALVVGDK
jgi:hypothetical protein